MNLEEQLDIWFEKSMQVSPARLARFDRKRLIQCFAEWGLERGAEIGVDRGSFSEYMFQQIPNLSLLCVDQWRKKLRGDSRYASSVQRLEQYGANIIRNTSMRAVVDVPIESLDFVYIDADHTFDFVMQDIIEWSKRVRIGGIVSGHDYYRFRGAGVVASVDAYTQAHGIIKWFVTDERTPTWFWRKE